MNSAPQLSQITVKECDGTVHSFPLTERGAQEAGFLAGKLLYEGILPFDAVCMPISAPSIGDRENGATMPRLWEIYENGNRCGFNKALMEDEEYEEEEEDEE